MTDLVVQFPVRPVRRVYQHGSNPEAVLILDPAVMDPQQSGYVLIADWCHRLHAYQDHTV